MKYGLALLLLLHALILRGKDSDPQLRFVSLGVQQGLSCNEVLCSVTDSRGFVWIGTADGLNRFDGHDFIVYKHHKADSFSIPDNTVYSLELSGADEILAGTDAGIVSINVWSGRCKNLSAEIIPDTPPLNYTFTDRSGKLWAWSLNVLYSWNENKKTFQPSVVCDNKAGHPDRIKSFYQDRRGAFWICSFNGIFSFDPKGNLLKQYSPSADKTFSLVNSMYEDEAGRFWCAGWGTAILEFNPLTGNFYSVRWDLHPLNPSATNIVYGFAEGKNQAGQSELWAATNAGLVKIHRGPNELQTADLVFYQHDESSRESLCSSDLVSVSVNRLGEIWVCTRNGVSVLLPSMQTFTGFAGSLRGDAIRLVPDREGNVFACTWYGDGLQLIDKDGNRLRNWSRVPEGSANLASMQISDVLRARDQTLWVASFGTLSHGDTEGKTFVAVPVVPEDPFALATEKITCLAEDDSGNIWCGTYGHGIEVFLSREKVFAHFGENANGTNPLPHPLIWDLLHAKDGTIWVATNNGIAHYDMKQRKMIGEKTVATETDSFRTGICYTIFEDRLGNIWFGTENGLLERMTNGKYQYFDEELGLAGNVVSAIAQDEYGHIWVAAEGGLSELNTATGSIRSFTANTGWPVLTSLFSLLNSGNSIIAGGHNGCIQFSPAAIRRPEESPLVYITRISSGTTLLNFENNPANADWNDFSWEQNSFSFDFISPGIFTQSFVRYEYRLAGETDWISSGNGHAASFARLSPGEHRFEVRAVLDGKPGTVSAWNFRIHPPFWKTTWFIVSAALLFIFLLVWFVYRESTRKMREQLLRLEKQQAVERERNRISRDMHDDLGSGLTRIAILSEVVKKKMHDPEAVQPHIQTISESARELVDSLNEIVWSLNPDNDKVSNLVAYLREYADRYLETFGIKFRTDIDETILPAALSEQKRRFVFLVVKEALHNIVKHAGASTVLLAVHWQKENLLVSIEDDGKGFETGAVRSGGNGLRNMQNRMASIGAVYSIDSVPGRGTRINLSVPFDNIA